MRELCSACGLSISHDCRPSRSGVELPSVRRTPAALRVGTAYLDNGEQVRSTSEGFWQESGKHKWRVRGTLCNSLGDVYQSDGVISLDGRTYKGTLTESA